MFSNNIFEDQATPNNHPSIDKATSPESKISSTSQVVLCLRRTQTFICLQEGATLELSPFGHLIQESDKLYNAAEQGDPDAQYRLNSPSFLRQQLTKIHATYTMILINTNSKNAAFNAVLPLYRPILKYLQSHNKVEFQQYIERHAAA